MRDLFSDNKYFFWLVITDVIPFLGLILILSSIAINLFSEHHVVRIKSGESNPILTEAKFSLTLADEYRNGITTSPARNNSDTILARAGFWSRRHFRVRTLVAQ